MKDKAYNTLKEKLKTLGELAAHPFGIHDGRSELVGKLKTKTEDLNEQGEVKKAPDPYKIIGKAITNIKEGCSNTQRVIDNYTDSLNKKNQKRKEEKGRLHPKQLTIQQKQERLANSINDISSQSEIISTQIQTLAVAKNDPLRNMAEMITLKVQGIKEELTKIQSNNFPNELPKTKLLNHVSSQSMQLFGNTGIQH